MIGFLGGLLGGIVGGLFEGGRQNRQHRQAKELAQQQLENSMALGQQAFNFRRQETDQDYGWKQTLANEGYDFQIRKANLDDEITRRQAQQRFGFEKTLADDNYAFRNKDRDERERAAKENMERDYQMRTETTDRARRAANSAFFGGGNRFNARR